MKRLRELTNYSQFFIESVARNAEAAELWSKEGVHYDDWFDGGQLRTAPFWCDVLVAEGILRRTRNTEGVWVYRKVKAT